MRYKNPPVGVVAIIERRGKFLFTRRNIDPKKGELDPLGGFVEIGESLEEAIAREVKEEIGCAVTNVRYFSSRPAAYGKRTVLVVHFICNIKGTPRTSREIQEIVWLKKISKQLAFKSDEEALREYVSAGRRKS